MTVIVVKGHRRGGKVRRRMARPTSRIDKQQILKAIVIEIEEGHSASHGFGQQLLSVRAVVVDKSNSSFAGNIGKFCEGDFIGRLQSLHGPGHQKDNAPCPIISDKTKPCLDE